MTWDTAPVQIEHQSCSQLFIEHNMGSSNQHRVAQTASRRSTGIKRSLQVVEGRLRILYADGYWHNLIGSNLNRANCLV